MSIQAIIFDCDGVLVDSERLGIELLVQMAQSYGYRGEPKKAYSLFCGAQLSTCLETIESEMDGKLPVDFIELYRSEQLKVFEKNLQTVPFIENVLENITLPKCIASNGPLIKIKNSLRITGLDRFSWDGIFSAYDVKSWKPDPGLFLHAAKKLGSHPKHTAVIEDSDPGITAAKAAGMRAYYYQKGQGVEVSEGVTRFGDMRELLELLER